MSTTPRWTFWLLGALCALPLWLPQQALAADHAESPAATADPSADIADAFIFRADGKLVGAITFGGIADPNPRVDGPTGRFDPDVLFIVNIDTSGDALPEHEILVRFGRNAAGEAGVQFENVPGAGVAAFSGPVERVLASPTGLRGFAGLRDDPFFFDSRGFNATLATFNGSDRPRGTLMFNAARDTFSFRNLTAIVFEMDLAAVPVPAGGLMRVWAESNRLVGGAQ